MYFNNVDLLMMYVFRLWHLFERENIFVFVDTKFPWQTLIKLTVLFLLLL